MIKLAVISLHKVDAPSQIFLIFSHFVYGILMCATVYINSLRIVLALIMSLSTLCKLNM